VLACNGDHQWADQQQSTAETVAAAADKWELRPSPPSLGEDRKVAVELQGDRQLPWIAIWTVSS
jgi:hypothetical protein